MRAERRLGEYLRDMPNAPTGPTPRAKVLGTRAVPNTPTLADISISKKLSAEAQRLASIPAATFARVKRRLGEYLRDMPKQHGARGTGANQHRGGVAKPDSTSVPTLASQGIDKRDAAKWQALAAIPVQKFERFNIERRIAKLARASAKIVLEFQREGQVDGAKRFELAAIEAVEQLRAGGR